MSTVDSSLIRPPALKPGDRVHVISPAGPVIPEIIAEGIALFRRWELDVVVDDHVYRRRHPYEYLAGSDKARLNALQKAWTEPDCRAIICSRGGYGAMRLLPHLDIGRLAKQPRLLLGFSDITALHLYLAGVGGLATLHGPVLKSIPLHDDDEYESVDRLHEALFVTADTPRPWTELKTVRSGTGAGPVFGGNLSLIVPLLGSSYAPSLNGAILIIEEVGEQDYRLDRLFTALRLADGVNPAGIVLGDFSDCSGVYVPADELYEFVCQLAAEFDCPVVADAPVGHGSRNVSFPIGVRANLDADAGTLTFHSHAAQRSGSP